MQQASCLEGAHCCGYVLYLHINQKSDDDDDDDQEHYLSPCCVLRAHVVFEWVGAEKGVGEKENTGIG